LETEKDHQVTIAAILAIASRFGGSFLKSLTDTAWPFLKENWKQISYIALLAWAVMCLLTHCAGVIDPWGVHGGNAPDTVSVRMDTAWVYPDTTAIFALHGFDTIPRHIERLNDSIRRIQSRFRPRSADHSADDTCADSIATLRNHSEVLTSILDECDEAYHDAIALRTYGDTLRNDSIEVAVNFRVEGRLKGVPLIGYRYLAPYPVITNTVTVNATVRRQVYIDGGIGPRLTFENVPNAIEGSLGLGFVNRNNLSMGIEAGISHADYRVGVRVRKGFSVGK
jgi:hypothetical protein